MSKRETIISRRNFLKLTLQAGGTLAAGAVILGSGCIRLLQEEDPATNPGDNWHATVCGICTVGCGVLVRTEKNTIMEVRGIPGYPVNDGRLCVKGIYQHLSLVTPGRADTPLRRQNGVLSPLPWDDTIDDLARRIGQIQKQYGNNAVAVYHGGQLLLEEYYVIGKFALTVLGTEHLDTNARLCIASFREAYNLSFGIPYPPPGYQDIEQTGCLLIVGNNTAEQHPILFQRIRRARNARHFPVIVVDPRITPTAGIADLHLRVRAHTDVALLNAMIQVMITEELYDKEFVAKHTSGFAELSRLTALYPPERAAAICGIAAADIVRAARLIAAAPTAAALWMVGVNQKEQGTAAGAQINNLCLLTGNVGRPGAGPLALIGQTSSSAEAGSYDGLPAGRKLDNDADRKEMAALWEVEADTLPRKNRNATEDLWRDLQQGQVKALWVIGSNPVISMPDQATFRRLLDTLDLLIVQDGYTVTETAKRADILLPAAMWGEKEGVFINSERRVSYTRKVVEPPGQALPDWEIFTRVAAALGASERFPYQQAADIFREWQRASRGTMVDMTGMDYELLQVKQGIQYPSETPGAGTPRLYENLRFPTANRRARLVAADYLGTAEEPDDTYPFFLLTGRLLAHWQTMTKTGHIPELLAAAPHSYVEINPEDAGRLQIEPGEKVRVASRRGDVVLPARLTVKVPAGHVFIPYHFPETPVNMLTPHLLDPHSKQPALKAGAVRIEKSGQRPAGSPY